MDTSLVLGLVIAAFVIGFWTGRASLARPPAPQAPVVPPPPEKLEEIRRILLAGEKLEAIRIYRDATGAGLREARDAVEKLQVS